MLSNASRFVTYLLAALYAVLGSLLLIFPKQLAPVFAWKVTPFMTMTIGSWCLGNAWLAFLSARRWEWRLVLPRLLDGGMLACGERHRVAHEPRRPPRPPGLMHTTNLIPATQSPAA